MSRFLTAGWDVYRYNRRWVAQTGQASDEDAQEMVASIAAVRAAGYARIVLAGQSHGGWMSLAAVAHGAKVDGIVAVAPGRHGKEPEGIKPRSDFQLLLRDIHARAPTDLSMMFVFFRDDDHDPWGRHQDVPDILGNSGARLQVIDRPEGFKGHRAGGTGRFNDVYGPCIFRFITGAAATASSDCR